MNKSVETVEVWKDIKDYEGRYQVSTFGKIKILKTNKIIKGYSHKSGYLRILLNKNNKRKNYTIHRLVALTFIKNPENKPQVNHKDGIKFNNHINNLEWNTKSENEKHAYKLGLKKKPLGETNGNSKLTEKTVLTIRYLDKIKLMSQKKIAKFFNITPAAVSLIVNKKTWKHLK